MNNEADHVMAKKESISRTKIQLYLGNDINK